MRLFSGQLQVICLLTVMTGLVLASSPVARADDTVRKHINPTLGEDDDYFFSRQAKAFLDKVDEVLALYPPKYPEPLQRRLALMLIDGVAHEPWAPCRPRFQQFHHDRIEAAVRDMETRKVTSGAYIWKLYNHGFVVRTASVTMGFDLYRGPSMTKMKDPSGKTVRIPCPGFPISDDLARRLANQCDVLFISHAHRDHADPFITAVMLSQGKPVVTTSETFTGKFGPTIDPKWKAMLTIPERVANKLQELPVKHGKVTLKMVVYPGQQYQNGGPLCNTVLVFTPEGLSFAHNGDQINDPYPEYQEDYKWIDHVHEHFKVDVLMTNCWLNDPMRFTKGFDPKLVIMGHEIEMGHNPWDRMAYWGDAEFIHSTYPQLMHSHYPVLVMAWGEKYHYDKK